MSTPTPLRMARLMTGMTLTEVARLAGMDKSRLSLLERGLQPKGDEHTRIMRVLSGDSTPERLVPVPGVEQPKNAA